MYHNILDFEVCGCPSGERLPQFLATFAPAKGGGMSETMEKMCSCIFCQHSGYHKILTVAANNELVECPKCKLQFISRKES